MPPEVNDSERADWSAPRFTVWLAQKIGAMPKITSSSASGTLPGVGSTAPAVVLQAVVPAHEASVPFQ